MIRARLVCTWMPLLAAGLAVSNAAAGPAGFAFLEIPTGARASGMGGAYASVAQGAEAAFWNPAGLEGVNGVEVTGGHYEMFEKLRHDHFSVAGRMLGGGVSGSLRALYSEPIDERDELGNLIGSFGSHDLEFGLEYGHPVGWGASVGGSAQILRERIANSSVTAPAFGLGGTWQPPGSTLRVSLSGHNLGPTARYRIDGTEGDPISLPTAFQGGVSYQLPLPSRLEVRGALEGRITRGRNGVGMVGAEISHPAGAALRAGLRVNDSASSFSVGAGYSIKSLGLDYAYVPLREDLGDTQRFSFFARF